MHHRLKTTAAMMLSLCLVGAGLVNVDTASAMVYMQLTSHPASISNDTTPTFTFDAFDMDIEEPYSGGTECKVDTGPFSACTSPFTTSPLAVGDHTVTIHAVGQSGMYASFDYTWNINQTPVFSGGTAVSGVSGTPIAVTDLQIDDADNDMLQVNLSVPSGTLKLGTAAGITFSGAATGASITFSGTRTNLNTALSTLIYTPSSTGTIDIDATLKGAGGGARDTYNGHFYQVIDTSVNWPTAKSSAEAATFGGVSGYLATVTSAGEEDYLQARMHDGVWIGGSDSASEGNWRWVSGPENGTLFSIGNSPVGGVYTLWQAGQPDNNGTENCLELRLNGSESWNDEKCGSARRYAIEYGTNGALPSLDSAQVSTTAISSSGDLDNDGISNSIEASAPNGGDANNDSIADYTQANVTSKYSALSEEYVVIQTSCTANQQVRLSTESSSQKDSAYDYPYGLASFTGTSCGAPGATVTVTQYYYNADNPSELTLRKWNSATGSYSTIYDATLSSVTIGGEEAVKVVYQIVDGDLLDQDGVANGNVTDPVGLATIVLRAPSTGVGRTMRFNPVMYIFLGLSCVIAGAVYMLNRRV